MCPVIRKWLSASCFFSCIHLCVYSQVLRPDRPGQSGPESPDILSGFAADPVSDIFLQPLLTRAETDFEPEMEPYVAASLVDVELKEIWRDTPIQGYLARPRDQRPLGAVLLIHDMWGLTDGVRKQTRNLARDGFVSFALDLYRGHAPSRRKDAVGLMRSLEKNQANRMTSAALDWLNTQSSIEDGIRTGVVGWGIGGAYALELSIQGTSPDALVLFYSDVSGDHPAVGAIQCPLLGFYALRDFLIIPERVRSFGAALHEKGHRYHELVFYDTIPGFSLKPVNPLQKSYAETAYAKMASFLKGHLHR